MKRDEICEDYNVSEEKMEMAHEYQDGRKWKEQNRSYQVIELENAQGTYRIIDVGEAESP